MIKNVGKKQTVKGVLTKKYLQGLKLLKQEESEKTMKKDSKTRFKIKLKKKIFVSIHEALSFKDSYFAFKHILKKTDRFVDWFQDCLVDVVNDIHAELGFDDVDETNIDITGVDEGMRYDTYLIEIHFTYI